MSNHLRTGSDYIQWTGCRTVCAIKNCDEIATKYYTYQDPEFYKIFKDTFYSPNHAVLILGVCDAHDKHYITAEM